MCKGVRSTSMTCGICMIPFSEATEFAVHFGRDIDSYTAPRR